MIGLIAATTVSFSRLSRDDAIVCATRARAGGGSTGLLMGASASARNRRNFLDKHPAQETGAVYDGNVGIVACAIFSFRGRQIFTGDGAAHFQLTRVGDEFGWRHDCAERAPDYLVARLGCIHLTLLVSCGRGLGDHRTVRSLGMRTALAIAAVCYAAIALTVLARVRRNARSLQSQKPQCRTPAPPSPLLFSVIAFSPAGTPDAYCRRRNACESKPTRFD